MNEVVIAGYLRTAQSKSKPDDPARDWFHKLRADDLLGRLIPELLDRVGIPSEEIDDFLVGSAMGVSEQWTYGGRTPLFLANLSEKVPAKFFDQQCGSSMAAVHMGFPWDPPCLRRRSSRSIHGCIRRAVTSTGI
jgi:acetyl-CoA C-acetyltransferase